MSVNREASVRSSDEAGSVLQVTREQLEKAIAPLVVHFGDLVEQTIRDANVVIENIELVEIVGGTTRVPALQEELVRRLQRSCR